MFSRPRYIEWIQFERDINVDNNITVHCYKLSYDINDNEIIMDWARHIRRHYIIDQELKDFRKGSEERKYTCNRLFLKGKVDKVRR